MLAEEALGHAGAPGKLDCHGSKHRRTEIRINSASTHHRKLWASFCSCMNYSRNVAVPFLMMEGSAPLLVRVGCSLGYL